MLFKLVNVFIFLLRFPKERRRKNPRKLHYLSCLYSPSWTRSAWRVATYPSIDTTWSRHADGHRGDGGRGYVNEWMDAPAGLVTWDTEQPSANERKRTSERASGGDTCSNRPTDRGRRETESSTTTQQHNRTALSLDTQTPRDGFQVPQVWEDGVFR